MLRESIKAISRRKLATAIKLIIEDDYTIQQAADAVNRSRSWLHGAIAREKAKAKGREIKFPPKRGRRRPPDALLASA